MSACKLDPTLKGNVMSLNLVPAGKSLPDDIYVIIEIPQNADPIKYEVDKGQRRHLR